MPIPLTQELIQSFIKWPIIVLMLKKAFVPGPVDTALKGSNVLEGTFHRASRSENSYQNSDHRFY